MIRKLGAYLRKRIGNLETDLAGRHRCFVCGEPTNPNARHWSSFENSFVDSNCIPAIVRAAGLTAVHHWLDEGEFSK